MDASDLGVGDFLANQVGNNLHIVAYYSHKFDRAQRRYSATRKECLALKLAIKHWRPYLMGSTLDVRHR